MKNMNIHEFVVKRRQMESNLKALIEAELQSFLKNTGYPVVGVSVTLRIERTVEKVISVGVYDVNCQVDLNESVD